MATLSISPRHLDEVVTAYVEWHKYSQSVQTAYDAWSGASGPQKSLSYAAYLAELDREERACETYAATVARAGVGANRP